MTGRFLTVTGKVETDFGSMYLHVDFDGDGRPAGGGISTPGKENSSQIARLVASLSAALESVLSERSRFEADPEGEKT